MYEEYFTPAELVTEVLKSLKPKSSFGPDGLPAWLAHNIGNPLAFIFES